MGDLLEWKKGKPKAKTSVTGPPEGADGPQDLPPHKFVEPVDILRAALENHQYIEQIVVLVADDEGNLGLISNLDSPAENLLFIEGMKQKIIEAQFENGKKPATTPPEAS